MEKEKIIYSDNYDYPLAQIQNYAPPPPDYVILARAKKDKKTQRDFEFLSCCKNNFEGYITAICTYEYLKSALYSIIPGAILGVIIGIIISLVEGFSHLSIVIPFMTIASFPVFMLVGRPVYGFIFACLFCWIGYPIYKTIYNLVEKRNKEYKEKIIYDTQKKQKETYDAYVKSQKSTLNQKINYFQNHEHIELFANLIMPDLLSTIKSTDRLPHIDTIPISIVFYFYDYKIDYTINYYSYYSSGMAYPKDSQHRIKFETHRIANLPNLMSQLAFGITLTNKLKEMIDTDKDTLQKENKLDYDYTINVEYGPKKIDYFDEVCFIIKLNYIGKNKNYKIEKGW